MTVALAAIGHNGPPDPFGAIQAHLDDLLLEAHNWADGVVVETDEQDAAASRLIDDLRDAEKAAEAERVKEKAPLDEQIKTIQDRYNVYIAPLKNKTPGKIPLAISALLATVQPYRERVAEEKRQAAEKARLEAIAKAEAAAKAVRDADAADLGGREAAEALVADAAFASREAARAERGAIQGSGLTTYWEPVLTDQKAAVLFYMRAQPDRFIALALELAQADVRAGKRQIDGFSVEERKRAR